MIWHLGALLTAIGLTFGQEEQVIMNEEVSKRAAFGETLYGFSSGGYVFCEITVGFPLWNAETDNTKNTFVMIFDTGSSNDAVAGVGSGRDNVFECIAEEGCTEFRTLTRIDYGDVQTASFIQGPIVQDAFSGPLLGQHTNLNFINIQQQKDFFKPDQVDKHQGIIGAAYALLAKPKGNAPATFLDRAVKEKNLPDVFGLQMCGINQGWLHGQRTDPRSRKRPAGKWIVGGQDDVDGKKLYKGELFYTPIVQEKWYVVAVTDIMVDGRSLGIPCVDYNSPGALLDSGTTNLILPSAVYRPLRQQLEMAARKINFRGPLDTKRRCCSRACDPRDPDAQVLKLPTLTIQLALDSPDDDGNDQHFVVSIPPQYYMRPDITSDNHCRVFGIAEGSYHILGKVFLDGLYTFHDRENARVGMGIVDNCPSPNLAVSTKEIRVTQKSENWCDCLSENVREDADISPVVGVYLGQKRCFFWMWWMTVMAVCCSIIFISVVIITVMWCKKRKRKLAYVKQVSTHSDHPAINPGAPQMHSGPRKINHQLSHSPMHEPIPMLDGSMATPPGFPKGFHQVQTPPGSRPKAKVKKSQSQQRATPKHQVQTPPTPGLKKVKKSSLSQSPQRAITKRKTHLPRPASSRDVQKKEPIRARRRSLSQDQGSTKTRKKRPGMKYREI